jgi:DNA polymerase-1
MAGQKLVLIDGNALLHRAYHGIPPLTSPTGEPTNAVYGFTTMLFKALSDLKPDYIAVAFDVGRTFRHDEFPEYKATRAKMPDDLEAQFEPAKAVIDAFGIPQYYMEGYEADDVVGTLARQATEQDIETVIVTGDTDILQLVSPHTKVLISGRTFSETVLYDEEKVRERYGLEPGQLTDLRGLKGDSSDNIPGVARVGVKTATPLLQKYGTVEEVYQHLTEIESNRARNALTGHEDVALLSKRLATIVTSVPLELDLEACRVEEYDREEVMRLFRGLGFASLVGRLPGAAPAPTSQLSLFEEAPSEDGAKSDVVSGEYRAVRDTAALKQVASILQKAPTFALDVETTGLDSMRATLVGMSVSPRAGEAYYIPVGHDRRLEKGPQLTLEDVWAYLRPILQDASIAKCAQNAKFDLTVLSRHGIDVQGLDFDTMLAAYLSHTAGRNLGLKGLAWQKLGVEMQPISELIGKGKSQVTMAQLSVDRVTPYACADADMTLRLRDLLEKDLREDDAWGLFARLEMPLLPVLMDMECTGVALDVEYLNDLSRELYQSLQVLEGEIHRVAKGPFNINSTQQLGQVLFERLGLPAGRRTKTGYSTSASVLEGLRGKHPVVDLVLEYRQLSKLKSTYTDALPLLVNPETGRVHTSFNQTGTVTGRLSSSDPNLQNIPIRTEMGRRIRRSFIAREGCVLLCADYSQVELRVLAHLAQDPNLLAAFARGEDVHATTASAILGVPLAKVTPDMRRIAKTINFGLMYGMGEYGLASRIGLPQEEAAQFIRSYFERFADVKKYLDKTRVLAGEKGYVETLMGRRRYFPELRPGARVAANVRRGAERMAINMPIQGTAADIIKVAMVRLHRALLERGLDSRMTLQVHDELVLEVPQTEVDEVTPLVASLMENAFDLDAPLKVDMKVGHNWLDMTPC